MVVALSWAFEFAWLLIAAAILFFVVLRRTGRRTDAAVLSGAVVLAFVVGAILHPVFSRPPCATSSSIRSGTPAPISADDRIWKDRLSGVSVARVASAGKPVLGSIVVQDTSPVPWPTHGKLPFVIGGYHWQDARGATLSEGRFPLYEDFAAGTKRRVPFAVVAPATPGDYWLQLDLLVEGVDWFANRGNSAVRVKVKVTS